MIYCLAPKPNQINDSDGFLIRVANIDRELSNFNVVYHYADDPDKHLDALISAKVIYVHSIYYSKEILPIYRLFGDKMITDLHGSVPEEELMQRGEMSFSEWSMIEKEVFRYGKHFVAVSEVMKKYYQEKYPESVGATWIVLPANNPLHKSTKRVANTVIYAGGLQKWQNIELMKDLIIKTRHRNRYTLLVHDPKEFWDKFDINNTDDISCKNVQPSEVSSYFDKSQFGLVLRDDNTVNRVSCPTKLVEYISHGVIPIVKSAKLGDFKNLGYRYIKYDDFIKDDFHISQKTIIAIRTKNYNVAKTILKLSAIGADRLRELVSGILSSDTLNLTEGELFLDTVKLLNEERTNYVIAQHESQKIIKERDQYLDKIRQSKRWKLGELYGSFKITKLKP